MGMMPMMSIMMLMMAIAVIVSVVVLANYLSLQREKRKRKNSELEKPKREYTVGPDGELVPVDEVEEESFLTEDERKDMRHSI